MRQLKLINGLGETLDVTSRLVFAHELSGFGYDRSETFRQIGDRFIRVNKKTNQNRISCKVFFAPFYEVGDTDPYDKYFSFAKFCNIEPLTMVYTPNKDTYHRRVSLIRVDKGELDKTGSLIVDAEFVPHTPWYRIVRDQFIVGGSSTNPLIWDDTTNPLGAMKWGVTWGDYNPMTLRIDSDSWLDSPCKLIIHGNAVNPSWKHYVNGVLTAEGQVNTTVKSGARLLIDTTRDPYSISVLSVDGTPVRDAYDNSDFETERFITIKRGINSIAVTNHDANSTRISLEIEAHLYYETV